jgi:hypothetical protein
MKLRFVYKGGPGSGFAGHAGIPGHQGGSQSEGGASSYAHASDVAAAIDTGTIDLKSLSFQSVKAPMSGVVQFNANFEGYKIVVMSSTGVEYGKDKGSTLRNVSKTKHSVGVTIDVREEGSYSSNFTKKGFFKSVKGESSEADTKYNEYKTQAKKWFIANIGFDPGNLNVYGAA